MKPHHCGNATPTSALNPGDKAALEDFKRYLELKYASDNMHCMRGEDIEWLEKYEKGQHNA